MDWLKRLFRTPDPVVDEAGLDSKDRRLEEISRIMANPSTERRLRVVARARAVEDTPFDDPARHQNVR